MGTPKRDQQGLPSLIDFGEDDDPLQFKPLPVSATPQQAASPNPFEVDSWQADTNGSDLFSASFTTPYKSPPQQQQQHHRHLSPSLSPQPDLLTGDFPVTPPTTIPGVQSATELDGSSSSWPSAPPPSDNPFDSPFDSPFIATSSSSSSSYDHGSSRPAAAGSPASVSSSSIDHRGSGIPPPNAVRHSQSTPELRTSHPAAAAAAPSVHGSFGSSNGMKPPLDTFSNLSVSSKPRSRNNSVEDSAAKRPSEFLAGGGGRGVYKPPARGPVDPDRPVPFDLRPSPMRTDQPARALTCTEGSVWLGCDGALKIWDVENAMAEGSAGEGNPADDIDAAAFTYVGLEAAAAITLCLVPDAANKLVWSGHRDGKVRAWPTEIVKGKRRSEPSLCWMAHRSPVLSMVITSYGELWTGSEGGAIRAWPWESTAHGLCLAAEETRSAASLMARSYIDLRARGTAAGASSLGNTDVHFLLAEHSNGRVWSGGPLLLALWDARTRDVLKVFGPSVQSEFSSPDISPVRDNMWEESSYSKAKKEKATGTFSFFQRVIGAADAVRRAAGGGQAGDDSKRLEALVATVDGTVWGGYASGMLVQWDGLGNRMQELIYIPVAVRCLCAVGTRIWVGYGDGRIQVLADTGKVLGTWIAHSAPISHMAKYGSYIFTLAAHGGIRGWNVGSPCPIDGILQIEMQSKADSYTQERNFKVLAGTWNVAEEKASLRSLQMWLSAGAAEAGVVFVGLQEMEMGAGAIAMAAAKETVGLQEKGSANGQWWLDNIGAALGENAEFVRVGSRQLAGILIGVWIRTELIPYVGEIDAAAVPCGFGRALGNKGGVGVKMLLYRRTFCFLSSHFAAHMDAITRRNADFEHIYYQMKFGRSTGPPVFRGATVRRTASPEVQDIEKDMMESETIMEPVLPDLADADMIVWVGDFNYRIDDLSYEDVVDLISVRQWDVLLPKDQLRTEMTAGRVFQGMREGPLRFQPTYKFDKGYNHVLGYDSSEKKRIPAWCDRVIFRDSYAESEMNKKSRLSHPVSASVMWYDACMDVLDSDHKPVRCLLNVDVAVINEAAKRRAFCELVQNHSHVQKWAAQMNSIPETVLNTNKIILEDGVPSVLKVINESQRQNLVFLMRCEGDPAEASVSKIAKPSLRAAYGFPLWLQVLPASGMIPPKGSMEITLRYLNVLQDDFMEGGRPGFGDNDNRGKVVNLVFAVKGPLSSSCKSYQVSVCSPSVARGSQEREPNFRLQRSDVLATRLNSQDFLL